MVEQNQTPKKGILPEHFRESAIEGIRAAAEQLRLAALQDEGERINGEEVNKLWRLLDFLCALLCSEL